LGCRAGVVWAWVNNTKNISLTPFFPKNSPPKLIMEYVADSVSRLKKIHGPCRMTLMEKMKNKKYFLIYICVSLFFCASPCWAHLEMAPDQAIVWGLSALLGICMVVFLLFFFWNRRLKREIALRKQIEAKMISVESKLTQNETRYRALFEHNPIQTIIVDENARIIMHNFAGKKTQGSLPAVGDVMYKDYAKKHSVDMHDALVNCIRKNQHRDFPEIKYKERYLNINIAPFSQGAIITLIDVTEKRQMMDELQQVRKMEAIGTLAGGVAHDFNNLLSIILGNMELALDEVPQWSSAQENLKEIQTAGLRARDVVHQLLSFSRKCDISRNAVDLLEIVQEAGHLLRALIPPSIEIKTDMQQAVFPIKADPTQIQQIIINLSTNGAHAMEEKGTGVLTIGLENVLLDSSMDIPGYDNMAPGKYVVLCVTDTGHGIDTIIQKKLFDPYFTTKEVGKGTGMGLSVVHGIVKSHDAAVQVQSQPGKGTTVKVFFPANESDLSSG